MTMLRDKAGSKQVGGWRETASRPTAFVSKQPRGAGAGSSPSTARILFVWHLAGEQQGCKALRPPPTVPSVQSQLLHGAARRRIATSGCGRTGAKSPFCSFIIT